MLRGTIVGFALVLSFYTGAFAQGGHEANVDLLGEVKNGKYVNSLYGFEFTVPKGWYVANSGDVDTIKRFVREGLSDYKISKNSGTGTEQLSLMLSRNVLGEQKNSVIGFSVAKQPSDRVTPTMLATAMKPMFVGANGTSLEKDIRTEFIGGKTFAIFDMLIESSLGKQSVRVYVTMLGVNAVTFVLTYWNEEDKKTLETSIQSIRFSKQ